MDEEVRIAVEKSAVKRTQTTRRAFVKLASQVAVTAPAVNILLVASTRTANAQLSYVCAASAVRGGAVACDLHTILDSHAKNIAPANLGTIFNPFNGANNLDAR